MIRSLSILAVVMGAGSLLAACDKPINDGPHPTSTPAAQSATPATNEVPVTSGGPAGQTPSYGQPGAAPSEVTSQPDETGPSASDSSGSVR